MVRKINILLMKKPYLILCLLLLSQMSKVCYAQSKNIALHKPVTVISADPNFPAKNITDGVISRNSKWQAATNKAPHIIEIDLQKYYNVHEVKVHSGIPDQEKQPNEMNQAAGFWSVKNFKLQYWDDANWTDFPKSEVHENRLVTATFQFQPEITTYKIRLVCDDGEAINVMEIEAVGAETPNMPAPPNLISSIQRTNTVKGPQQASITITPKTIGKSLKFVGYNQGYYMPGSNVSGWMEYSNVNSVRLWATLNAFVPENAVQVDTSVASLAEFDKRKKELRTSPEHNRFIQWDTLNPLYDQPDSSSTNAMVYNYALTELKRLGIQVVLQIGSTDFSDNWENKWKQWQRYYALAYHSAKTGDVAMFAMQNEPNHRNSGPMKLDQWIMGMQITSDAIHRAVEDVNKKYGKHLEAKFVGPVTAGQNTDWWAAIAKAIRTDYRGQKVPNDQIDIFSTHSYNSPAIGYASRIDNIRKILVNNHPEGQSLPIVYTEIGRWMNAYLIDKEETMDSPSLFTEWAGIYANNMNNGGYGMWAFKFANTASGPYPRGIKSGHHFIWQGKRIVEDAYQNLALHKPVQASASISKTVFVTDGDKSDSSALVFDGKSAGEKWATIDFGKQRSIGSAVVYTGSAYGVYTSPDRIKNFKLQYFDQGIWKDIPGASEKECRYAQVFTVFKHPVSTQKVRFVSTDKGEVKLREIKLFAAGDGPSNIADFNVSGIQRTGEVVRLFAKGFKGERPLLETKASVNDSDFDHYTAYNKYTGNYYVWLVQRGSFRYELALDLKALTVAAGTEIIEETVSKDYYGEVSHHGALPADKTLRLTLAPQSVVLLTIPSGKLKKQVIPASDDATVIGGKNRTKNYGKLKYNRISLDAAQEENNQVSYIRFHGTALEDTKSVILAVKGKVNQGAVPFRLHVYAVPSASWQQNQLNWEHAPLLDKQEALVHEVGTKAFVAGELAFDTSERWHSLDVTKLVHDHVEDDVTFILVRETRQLGDDADKGRTVHINALESEDKPKLMIQY